jgi:hypothetical protein
VTTAAGTNETAAVDDEQQTPDEGCKGAVKQVEEAFAIQAHCRPSTFEPMSCSADASAASDRVAAGINYFAMVDVHPCDGVHYITQHGLAFLRIYKGENTSAILLDDLIIEEETNTSLVDFGNETAGETPSAAAGNGTSGMTLGSGSCKKANEPCPSDPSTCCSGSCGPLGGYVTGFEPFVCQ